MALGVDYLEAEVVFEGVEVTVVMEEGMAFGDAEGCYDAVDGFADGDAASTEEAIVIRGGYGYCFATCRKQNTSLHFNTGLPKVGFLSKSLQDLA